MRPQQWVEARAHRGCEGPAADRGGGDVVGQPVEEGVGDQLGEEQGHRKHCTATGVVCVCVCVCVCGGGGRWVGEKAEDRSEGSGWRRAEQGRKPEDANPRAGVESESRAEGRQAPLVSRIAGPSGSRRLGAGGPRTRRRPSAWPARGSRRAASPGSSPAACASSRGGATTRRAPHWPRSRSRPAMSTGWTGPPRASAPDSPCRAVPGPTRAAAGSRRATTRAPCWLTPTRASGAGSTWPASSGTAACGAPSTRGVR